MTEDAMLLRTQVTMDSMNVRACLEFAQNRVGCVCSAVAATLADVVILKASQCSRIVACNVGSPLS